MRPLYAQATVWFDVTSKIDGSDWFEITGNTWRWEHRNYAVPEYHEGVAFGTIVNGQSFLSTWPSGPTDVNGLGNYRPTSGTYSNYNTVTGLQPIQDVIDLDTPLSLTLLYGRGSVSLAQSPSAANGYTLRVFLDDDPYGSHDFYRFQISGTPLPVNGGGASPVPEPATMSLLGLAGLVFKRRKRA